MSHRQKFGRQEKDKFPVKYTKKLSGQTFVGFLG